MGKQSTTLVWCGVVVITFQVSVLLSVHMSDQLFVQTADTQRNGLCLRQVNGSKGMAMRSLT